MTKLQYLSSWLLLTPKFIPVAVWVSMKLISPRDDAGSEGVTFLLSVIVTSTKVTVLKKTGALAVALT